MAILTNPAFGARTAIIYVTLGLLIDVWTSVWYFTFGTTAGENSAANSNSTWFWLMGFFLTGLSLIAVGLFLGPLGRAARRAELPPSDAMGMEASIQQTAAATPTPVIATTNPTTTTTTGNVTRANEIVTPSQPQRIVVGS